MAASELPATAEILLKSDVSKQFMDTLLGQGWDAWGEGLGGSQAAELMLEMFSAFNLVALAVISALFLWVLAVAVAGTAHEGIAANAERAWLRLHLGAENLFGWCL
jgi:conjugal transfer/type IV secretion protein DotA/TraY